MMRIITIKIMVISSLVLSVSCSHKTKKQEDDAFIKPTGKELYIDARLDSILGVFIKETIVRYDDYRDTCLFHLYLDNTYRNNSFVDFIELKPADYFRIPAYFSSSQTVVDTMSHLLYGCNGWATEANIINLNDFQGVFLCGVPGLARYRQNALLHFVHQGYRVDIHFGIEDLFYFEHDLEKLHLPEYASPGYKWGGVLSKKGTYVVPGLQKEFYEPIYTRGDQPYGLIATHEVQSWQTHNRVMLIKNYTDLSIDSRIYTVLDQFIGEDPLGRYRYEINVNKSSDYIGENDYFKPIRGFELLAIPIDSVSKEYTNACLFYFMYNNHPIYIRSNLEKLFRTEHSINQNSYNLNIDSIKNYIRKWNVEFTYNEMKINILDNSCAPQYIQMKYGELDSLYVIKKDKDNWKTSGWMESPFSEKHHWIQVYGDTITEN